MKLPASVAVANDAGDVLLGDAFRLIADISEEADVPIRRQTYAAAARGMLAALKADGIAH